jgi:hypothetical protein
MVHITTIQYVLKISTSLKSLFDYVGYLCKLHFNADDDDDDYLLIITKELVCLLYSYWGQIVHTESSITT